MSERLVNSPGISASKTCENACYQSVCRLPFVWKLWFPNTPHLPFKVIKHYQKITGSAVSYWHRSVGWDLLWKEETSASPYIVIIITCNSPEKYGGRCWQCANIVTECFTYQPLLFHVAAVPLWLLPAALATVLLMKGRFFTHCN